ncbi:hypothetical protein CQW23_06090 [Capsicum baccatum]|uniref:Calmodulin-binding domain-containing protein n=1 Tax=Capsicum baccatum TaxID=33114 RepID=A0A2G2X2A8_CAPBA|nr:hypothetical protein CQW23_06090 [Capsicum baccatum]
MLVVIVVMVGIVVTVMIVAVDSDGGGCDVTLLDCSGIQILMAEDNYDELASPVTSVKNGSTAKDNTDELVSPVTSVKNDSMAEDNINELVSPVTSMKNDSSGSKPDKISTIKLRSMSNGNKRAFTGSCHAFCKYGRKHSSEVKSWHPLSKRKNKFTANEQSPARTLVGDAKKGTLVKQKPSNPPESVLGEKKKVTKIEQKIIHFANRGCKPELEKGRNST